MFARFTPSELQLQLLSRKWLRLQGASHCQAAAFLLAVGEVQIWATENSGKLRVPSLD